MYLQAAFIKFQVLINKMHRNLQLKTLTCSIVSNILLANGEQYLIVMGTFQEL